MTGFKPRASGIGSNRSTNWATTTANLCQMLHYLDKLITIIEGIFNWPWHWVFFAWAHDEVVNTILFFSGKLLFDCFDLFLCLSISLSIC